MGQGEGQPDVRARHQPSPWPPPPHPTPTAWCWRPVASAAGRASPATHLVLLDESVDDTHAKSYVQHVSAARTDRRRVALHQRRLPIHHHSLACTKARQAGSRRSGGGGVQPWRAPEQPLAAQVPVAAAGGRLQWPRRAGGSSGRGGRAAPCHCLPVNQSPAPCLVPAAIQAHTYPAHPLACRPRTECCCSGSPGWEPPPSSPAG